MSYVTVPEGEDPLEHRAEMIAKYDVRTFNMIRTAWVCSACGAEVPGPAAMAMPDQSFPSLGVASQALTRATESAMASGEGPDPCPKCGGAPRLATSDLHLYSSKLSGDIVVRFTPNQPMQTLSWSPAGGFAPLQASPELEESVARDAVFRAIGVAREHDDYDAGRPLLAEAIRTLPGDPMLLKWMPWITRVGDVELGKTLADAYARAKPAEGDGYYWQGQLLFEAINSNRAPRAQLDQVVSLFGKALSLQPDYPDALIGQANIARMQGREADAERALRDLLARHPTHPEANYTLGLILLPKNPAEALECFERGEKEAPEDGDYPRSRARALIALGRSDEARAAIARARELSPNDPRIDQVAAQIGSRGGGAAGGPTGSAGMTLAVRLLVAVVILGVLAFAGVMVMGALKTASTAAAPVRPPSAPAAPAAAPAPAAPRRK